MKKRVFIAAVVIGSILVTGCTESIFSPTLVLKDSGQRTGYVGVPFELDITAELRMEPSDDAYDYMWTLSSDHPPGTDWSVIDKRHVRLAGTPSVTGSFQFAVSVWSDQLRYELTDDEWPYTYSGGACITSEFTVVILETDEPIPHPPLPSPE